MNTEFFAAEIRRIIASAIDRHYGCSPHIPHLVRPPEGIDAEYALPCFPFASSLRQSPAKIAETIASDIRSEAWLDTVSAEGPYLNFTLNKHVLFDTVINEAIVKNERYGHRTHEEPEKILVEYSSPNTNKPLHLGHVRNNVLGVAVINLLKAVGHDVIPATILNDRGIHICKAMVAYRHFGEGKNPEDENMKGDRFVGNMYVLFEQSVKNNPALMAEARQMLRDWENGDPETLTLWETMNNWVKSGFDMTYKRLGSHFDLVQSESKTYLLGKNIVAEGLKKGVFYRKEDTSVWIDLSAAGLDEKAVLRQDGTSLYITQDLGVVVERFRHFDINRIIYVVGSEQIYHFKVLFEMIKQLGFEWADRCTHLSYGMVYLPEGKMKSREGKVVDADTLIDRMQSLSREIMEASHFQVDVSRRDAIAEAIGIGAIKYYILKFNPQKDIHFDPEKSLSFDGATGAYVQYCHARIRSVLRKAVWNPSRSWDAAHLTQTEERDVVRSVFQLPMIIQNAADELNPSRLANHLWETAKLFNVFYTRHRILDSGSDRLTDARLALTASVANALKSGLKLLGMEAVEEM